MRVSPLRRRSTPTSVEMTRYELWGGVGEEGFGPLEEELHVGGVGVAAVVLTPG
jgi:hypothetical protein